MRKMEKLLGTLLISVLLTYVDILQANHIDVCQYSNYGWSDNNVGPWNVQYYGDDPGTSTTVAYFREEAVDCCGVFDALDSEVVAAGELIVHLWRPVSGGYRLIGQTATQCNDEGKCTETFVNNERLTVMAGDQIGWWSSARQLVKSSSWQQFKTIYQLSVTSPTVGQVIDWPTGATTTTNIDYGIRIDIAPNTDPIYTSLPDSVSVQESETNGFLVYAVTVDDVDEDDVTSLTVTMDTNAYFEYDDGTREVTVVGDLEQATTPQYLSFTVADQCHNTRTAILTVNLINEPPEIQNLPNTATIHENTNTETSLFTLVATDSHDVVTCSIVSVDTGNNGFILQKTSATEWKISTIEGSYFDYDVDNTHTLSIQCNDGSDTVSGTFILYLTPNVPPVISNLDNSTLLHEDTSTEELLYSLDVRDPDSASVTCALGTGTTPGATTNFTIRQKVGTTVWGIFTKAGAAFSYQSVSAYQLQVQCGDGRDTTTATFSVYLVRNEPPQITNLPDSAALSTHAPVGHTVFLVTTEDKEDDQLYFYMTCVPTACPFNIFSSGMVQLNLELSTSTSTVGYDVHITVGDSRSNGTTKTLTIAVVDINDIPEIQNLGITVNIQENNVINDVIAVTLCDDFDPGDTLTYSMTCTPASGTIYFEIDSSSGEIATTNNVINYETLPQSSFVCDVTCSDGAASDVKALNISVNDVNEAPVCGQKIYNLYADEGTATTRLQGTPFSASDEDAGDAQSFSLDCGTHTGYFHVDPTSGMTSFASDYDVDSGDLPMTLSCTLTVTDTGGLTDVATVSMSINNLNDNEPAFVPTAYTFFVSYYAAVSTSFGSVTASDADIGSFGQLSYTIDQTSLGDYYFGISQDGSVYVSKDIEPLGYDTTVIIDAVATDGGGKETRAQVTIVTSSTTIVATTTDTNRYRTFFEDSRNIGWLAAAVVGITATILASLYIALTYFGKTPKQLDKLRCRCCRMERTADRQAQWPWHRQGQNYSNKPKPPSYIKAWPGRAW